MSVLSLSKFDSINFQTIESTDIKTLLKIGYNINIIKGCVGFRTAQVYKLTNWGPLEHSLGFQAKMKILLILSFY